MYLNKALNFFAFFSFVVCFSQTIPPHTFGSPLPHEFEMKNYPEDLDAAGVILYERGNYTVDAVDGYIRLFKEVHRKIKVFDSKNFKYSAVEIPYYRQNNVRENIKDLRAVTHNGKSQIYVRESDIFDVDESQNWSKKRFAFANIQDGSILEYTYRIETPYLFNIGTWTFMNDLPTIYSELHTEIPGNYTYNKSLYGDRELDVNHAEIKLSCFHLPGYKVPGDCESATYVMKHVPAFKEEEYMLSRNNYIPSLVFELRDMVKVNRGRINYSKTWKDVDQFFKQNKDLGRQLKYSSYFKEKLPANVLSISSDLERAKAVYYFVQKNMNYNGKTSSVEGNRVKEAFDKGTGNSSEINLALINALEAGGLEAKLMWITTRDRALPTKQYPVMNDFNYIIVFLELGKEKYLLDATDKHTPFGVLPPRALNVDGRVMDFKNGSYWEPIAPIARNMHYANLQLVANEQGNFEGKINEVSTGYVSVIKRKTFNDYGKDEVIKRKQSQNEMLEVSNLIMENTDDLDQPFKESYDVSLYQQVVGERIYLSPFFMQTYFSTNPFQNSIREYPIDLMYPVVNNYLVSIDLNDQYEVLSVPENKLVRLPNDDGELSVVYDVSDTKINIRLNVRLNTYSFPKDAVESLREFFGALVKIQSDARITLKKI